MKRITTFIMLLGLIFSTPLTVESISMNEFSYKKIDDNKVLSSYNYSDGANEPKFDYQIEYEGNTYNLVDNSVTSQRNENGSQDFHKTIKRTVADMLYNQSEFTLEDAEKEITVTDGDKQYKAKAESIEYENSLIINRKTNATYTKKYIGEEQRPEIPQKMSFNVKDKNTGNNVTVTTPLKDVNKGNDYWKDITNPFTFKANNYNADTITITVNGKVITINKDSNSPIDSKYYDDLLLARGMNTKYYRLNSLTWDGEAYEENGVWYRNAKGVCQHKVADYIAEYGGEVLLPDYNGYKAIVVYGYDTNEIEYINTMTAEYIRASEPTTEIVTEAITERQTETHTESITEKKTEVQSEAPTEAQVEKENNTPLIILSISVGIVIIALAVVIILYIIQRKKVT